MLTWAGAYDQKGNEEEQYAIAKENGYYEVTYDWREPLKQSPAYYECAMSIDYPAEVAKIKVPLLAINGKADTTVVPETAQKDCGCGGEFPGCGSAAAGRRGSHLLRLQQ